MSAVLTADRRGSVFLPPPGDSITSQVPFPGTAPMSRMRSSRWRCRDGWRRNRKELGLRKRDAKEWEGCVVTFSCLT